MHLAGSAVPETLAAVLPVGAVGVERGTIATGQASGPIPELYPVEEGSIAGASERRRREFAEARRCARTALQALGVAAGPIAAAPDGAPVWPEGVVGSITHKGGYRAAVVAFAADIAGIGVDAEFDQPLPDGVLGTIASREELDQVEALRGKRPEVAWDRLLFCAKEAAVKAVRPLGFPLIGVRGVEVSFAAKRASLTATIPGGGAIQIGGAWTAGRGRVLTVARAG